MNAQALMPYIPVLVIALVFSAIGAEVVSAVRASRRPPSPEDGCCGCGAELCDVVVGPDECGRGEGYCWPCIRSWPADARPVVQLGFFVLPGRERGSIGGVR